MSLSTAATTVGVAGTLAKCLRRRATLVAALPKGHLGSQLTSACLVLFLLGAACLTPSAANAQDPVPVAGTGTDTNLNAKRSYFSPEPWEIFDMQTGNLRLMFTDLVLPGNNGRELRVVRSYSNQGPGGWNFGIAGLVTYVFDTGTGSPCPA